jgi:hypothetical protein
MAIALNSPTNTMIQNPKSRKSHGPTHPGSFFSHPLPTCEPPPPPYMKCHLHSGKQPVAFLMVLPAIGGSGKWFGPFGGQSQSSPSRVVAVR